jgi:hypothetical protein
MLVSSSDGFAREGLFAAILLRALMVAVVDEVWEVRISQEEDLEISCVWATLAHKI